MRNKNLSNLIKTSLLGVIAFLIMYLDFMLPMMPDFLKFDFSDIAALIGAFSLGPVYGVLIELVKNILHGLFVGGTAFVGELANFLVGSFFVFTAGLVYKRKMTKKGALESLAAASIVMVLVSGILNVYIFLPLYAKVLGWNLDAVVGASAKANPLIKDLKTYIFLAILPFNAVKAIVHSIITLSLYKKVSPILKQK
ncbi:MAG: ECF transporter S component [Bacillota bacterium]|nr:ECF transporter S component [Bacillota bacterium]